MPDREPRRVRRRHSLAGLALVLLNAPAFAQTAPISYPASRALPEVAAWLQRETPLLLGQVVDVGPSAITAITSVAPMGQPRGFLARAASEALAPQIIADEGVASWSIPVEVDCEQRLVRLGEMTGYKTRDLKTDGKIVREPNPEWVRPIPSAPLGAVIAALCDRDFKRPFAGKRYAALTRTPAAPAPAKLAEATPAPPPLRAAIAPKPPRPEPAPKAEPPARPDAPAKAETAKADAPKGGGSLAVQIGASPSKPDIEALLAKFRKSHGAELGGLSTDVATVESDGKTVNRALIRGFASNAEAGAFCKKLEASGQACFIRR